MLLVRERFTASPLEMAGNECANMVAGGCIFDGPEDANGLHQWHEGECALKRRGVRCPYFEKSVLPLSKTLPKYADVPAEYYRRAAKRQGIHASAVLDQIADVRRCSCGNPLAPRKQFCDSCRAKRLRESRRMATARFRG